MKKLLIPFLAFAVVTSSCKKNLELRPTDSIDIEKAFTSVNDLERGLMNVYSFNNITNRIYIGSILADEVKLSNENRGQGQFTFKWQFSSGDGEHNSGWFTYAFMTDRVNRILSVIDNIPANNPADVDRKARIKAELIGLRAVATYENLIRFMPNGYEPGALGVPVIQKVLAIEDYSRNTVLEAIDAINTDLATARASTQIPDGPTDVVRLSKSAIAAYQARTALLSKNWTNAITYATDAITLSGKSLASGITYQNYWKEINESETIWKYKNNTRPQLLWRETDGAVYFEPSDKLKNMFDRTNDIRYSTFFGSAGNDTSIITKYPGSAAGPQINDLKLIRLSEMYLLRAEAYAENNQLALAAADLNDVRRARIAGYVDVSFGNKDQAIAEIMNERFKELSFEGFRFFDLKRKELDITRNASDVQSANWQNLDAEDYRFALPIPQSEMDANNQMVQNPGYN